MSDYVIKEEKVFLNPTAWWSEERFIAELNEVNQQNILDSLKERFKELEEKVAEIKKEFETTDEKVKLAGKVSRTKNYICTAKAIGNYASILTQLDEMEAQIKVGVDEILTQKEKLVLEAEELLKTTEWKDGTEKLRELQKQFKDLATVPDLRNEEYRDRFEKAKDEFFKLKQASYETFEQDLLDNLSKKLDLCEKAESYSNSTEWKKTTALYQELNEEWKKIGMVPKHRNEELWFRFNTAKDIFFANKRVHIDEIKSEHEGNLALKLELIEKAEALKDSKDWKKTSEAYNALMEEWKKSGRVSNEMNDEVWEKFQAAKNHFYQNKDAYYANIKVQLEDNYAKKMAIVNHAETLQNTNDFESATQEFQDMFEEWKKIGRVPKEYGDEAWERFLKAKKNFFDRKDANREERKKTITKDINERVTRNRSFYNKVSRELQREEELLFDLNDRIANLPPTLRSYEKREQMQDMIVEVTEKINELKAKVKDVKDKIHADEREMNYILRGPKPKTTKVDNAKEEIPNSNEEMPIEETPKGEMQNSNEEMPNEESTKEEIPNSKEEIQNEENSSNLESEANS